MSLYHCYEERRRLTSKRCGVQKFVNHLQQHTNVILGKSKMSAMFKKLRDKGLVHDDATGDVNMVTFPLCRHRERADLVKFIKENNDVLDDRKCYTCHSISNALEDITHKNKSIKDRLVATSNVRKYKWPNKTFSVDINCIFEGATMICDKMQSCMDFHVFLSPKNHCKTH